MQQVAIVYHLIHIDDEIATPIKIIKVNQTKPMANINGHFQFIL